jgi:TctA family transporter
MVFLLSGLCGVLFLALPLKQPLLILFGGLFGIAGLIDGLVQKSSVVAQDTSGKCALPLTESFIGTGLSFFATFLPGLGTSQFSSFVSNDKTEPVAFLAYNASMNTTNVLFSIVALIALDNARSGAIAALMQIVQVPLQSLLFVSVVCVLSVCIAGVVTLWAARYVSAYFHLLPLKSIKLLVIIFLCGLIFWFDGFLGLCCVIVASAVGLYTIKKEAPKQYLMGCLLVPVLCFFLL